MDSSLFTRYTAQDWKTFCSQCLARFPKALTNGLSLNKKAQERQEEYGAVAMYLALRLQIYGTILGLSAEKPPVFVIAVTGSVASGKSTLCMQLKSLLEGLLPGKKVAIASTDGFLWPNATLNEKNIRRLKGFPCSYDSARFFNFLTALKKGEKQIELPAYSHLTYDVLSQPLVLEDIDVLFLEGVNTLQTEPKGQGTQEGMIYSDFADFSIYVDAAVEDVAQWYLGRFFQLRSEAVGKPEAFFYRYAQMSDQEALHVAQDLWHSINLKNLRTHISPTKNRANLILYKNKNHLIDHVYLRKF